MINNKQRTKKCAEYGKYEQYNNWINQKKYDNKNETH